MDVAAHRTGGDGGAPIVRVAAVGDLHVGEDSAEVVGEGFAQLGEHADVLLLAGDLTQHGTLEEGWALARELSRITVPTVAVLGNHDYHNGAESQIREVLESVGCIVLEGESIVIRTRGLRLGIAGVKGFGGGFAGACGTEFGEPEMKAFIHHSKRVAARLHDSLLELDCDVRVALTHYAPIPETLVGERLEIYPFLGSYFLGQAIDEASCHLALHGHAHRGSERGATPGGTPVRNVARPLIKSSYKIFCLGAVAIAEAC